MSFKYYSASLPTEQVLDFLFKTLECVVLAHLSSRRTPCHPTTLRCISNKPHPFQFQYLPVSVPRPADRGGGIELKPKSPPNPDDLSTKAEEKILLLNQKVMRILGNPLKGRMRGQSATSLSYAARQTQPHSRPGALNPPGRWAARDAHSSA